MGVMACSRRGCENIMCDVYITRIGYLCNHCLNEFTEKYSSSVTNVDEVFDLLDDFTNHSKSYTYKKKESGESIIRRFIDYYDVKCAR